jgi:hypothetical protein
MRTSASIAECLNRYAILRAVFFIAGLFLSTASYAHGGGLDASGCHHDRKRGGYHCHRGGTAPAMRAPVVKRRVVQPVEVQDSAGDAVPQALSISDSKPDLGLTGQVALPEPIIGIAQVLDGDTIQIGTTRIPADWD